MDDGTEEPTTAVIPAKIVGQPTEQPATLSGASPTRPMEAVDETIRGSALDGRYYVDRLLGEGGMGRVYLGTQLSIGRTVAIKVLHSSLSEDPTIRERFHREAHLISTLHHPNTVSLIDFGEAEGRLYIAMEFIDGVPLQTFAGTAPLNISFALEVVEQLCGPLAEAHQFGVVHRDLKPDNIFLTRDPEGRLHVKLLDFGVAHSHSHSSDRDADPEKQLTRVGSLIGTLDYMAPEQGRGEPATPSVDIYALGVILFQLLSGRLPFEATTPVKKLHQLLSMPAPPITDYIPTCPPAIAELVARLLNADAGARVASVVELGTRIRAIRETLELGSIDRIDPGELHDILASIVHQHTAKDWAAPPMADTAPLPVVPPLPEDEPLPPPMAREMESRSGLSRKATLLGAAAILAILAVLISVAIVASVQAPMPDDEPPPVVTVLPVLEQPVAIEEVPPAYVPTLVIDTSVDPPAVTPKPDAKPTPQATQTAPVPEPTREPTEDVKPPPKPTAAADVTNDDVAKAPAKLNLPALDDY